MIVLLYPVVIAPRFNKYTPLADVKIKNSILSMAHANGIPANDVYQVDASRQSDRVSANVSGLLGSERVTSPKPQMGAEDFSKYQKVIPGFFYWLGVGNAERGITAMLHTAEFDADERSLETGVTVMTSVLLDWLDRNQTMK